MLTQQIDEDLKTALKEKNEIVISSLRNLKAALKNVEIEKKQSLTDEETVAVIAKKVKQHKDSIESFKAGGRDDLTKHEMDQMHVLQKYLPKGLTTDELTVIVKKAIGDLSATSADFGKVMKEVMSKTRGQADGNEISSIVKDNLK